MRRIRTVVNLVITAALGIAVNYATGQNIAFLKPFLPFMWLTVGILMLLTIVVNLWEDFQTEQKGISFSFSLQKRQYLLTKLRKRLVMSRLSSLHNLSPLDLHIQKHPDFRDTKYMSHLFSAKTHITQVYDNVGIDLLIVGEEGGGKSTLLFDLAINLLDRAIKEKEHPFPLILQPLISAKRLSLFTFWLPQKISVNDWVIQTLQKQLQLPLYICQSLLREGHILLFIDGLDELETHLRQLHIDALIAYQKEYRVPLVICSRSVEEFKDFDFICPVRIEPLTLQQVDEYLLRAGEEFSLLRSLLQQNSSLQQLVITPYMLHLLMLIIQKASPDISAKQLMHIVTERYINYKLQLKGIDHPYTLHEIELWLSQLAKGQPQYHSVVNLPSIRNRLLLGNIISVIFIVTIILFISATLLLHDTSIFHVVPLITIITEVIILFTVGLFFTMGGIMRATAFGSERRIAVSNMSLTMSMILLISSIPILFVLPDGWKTLPLSLMSMFGLILYIFLIIRIALFIVKRIQSLWSHFFLIWSKRTHRLWKEQLFWDYAVELGILKKQGQKYFFTHKWLLDYFMHLDDKVSEK